MRAAFHEVRQTPSQAALLGDIAHARLQQNEVDDCAKWLARWEASVDQPTAAMLALRGDLARSQDKRAEAREHWVASFELAPSQEVARSLTDSDLWDDVDRTDYESTMARVAKNYHFVQALKVTTEAAVRERDWTRCLQRIETLNNLGTQSGMSTAAIFEAVVGQREVLAQHDARVKNEHSGLNYARRADLFRAQQLLQLAIEDARKARSLAPRMVLPRITLALCLAAQKHEEELTNLRVVVRKNQALLDEKTRLALDKLDHAASVTEKGFIIGGGGEDAFAPTNSGGSENSQTFRKDFRALAFWKTQVQTNADGEASFNFIAPDNLTSYHLVAIAQTKEHQFGQGETKLKVAKRLMIEPALTRFVRRGDQIELRAVVRQNYVDSAPVIVQCQVEGDIEWLGETQEAAMGLTKGLPQVVHFSCRVLGGDSIKVTFQAHSETDPSLKDAVELTLPVRLPGVLQRTGHYGVIPKQEASFPLSEKLPESWSSTTGSYDMTISHTPYLPELNSMPEILEYPHGCFEQKATRYLSYTQMLTLID